MNSGLDYWDGGIVEWWTGEFLSLFLLFVMLYPLVVLADLCYTFCVAGFLDFEDY